MSQNNGGNSRLDRIEKMIEQSQRASKEADARHERRIAEHDRWLAEHERAVAEHGRAVAEHDREMAEHRREMVEHGRAVAEHDREIEENRRAVAKHDREIEENRRAWRRVNELVRRFIKLGVKEARDHRRKMREADEKITQLAAAQIVTEEKLQLYLSSLGRSGNGKGKDNKR